MVGTSNESEPEMAIEQLSNQQPEPPRHADANEHSAQHMPWQSPTFAEKPSDFSALGWEGDSLVVADRDIPYI